MAKRPYRGAEYRVDAPGFDAREWAVVKIHIPVPWKYIDDPALSPQDIAEMFSGEIGEARNCFELIIEQSRRERQGEVSDG